MSCRLHLLAQTRNEMGVVTHIALNLGKVLQRTVCWWNAVDFQVVYVYGGHPEKNGANFAHVVPPIVTLYQVFG